VLQKHGPAELNGRQDKEQGDRRHQRKLDGRRGAASPIFSTQRAMEHGIRPEREDWQRITSAPEWG
jgi:hypothetical protein